MPKTTIAGWQIDIGAAVSHLIIGAVVPLSTFLAWHPIGMPGKLIAAILGAILVAVFGFWREYTRDFRQGFTLAERADLSWWYRMLHAEAAPEAMNASKWAEAYAWGLGALIGLGAVTWIAL